LGDAERSALARQRGLAPAQLPALVRGDLDWIVMKALEKNRTRRYDSASAFAGDVQRFLADEPLVARPPSTGYVLGKAIRRHRLAFTAAAAVAVALVGGAIVSTWQALRATRAEQLATQGEQEQRRLREVAQRARAAEAELRAQAEAQRLTARRQAYVSDMEVLQQSLAAGNLGRARQILDRHRPKSGETDLRGWEWRYLWQFCRDESVSQLSSEPIMEARLAASPDGEWLATAESSPDRVRLWNLRTREALPVPLADGAVWPAVAFVPHQPWVVVSWQIGRDIQNQLGHFRVWNYVTRQVVTDQPVFYGPTQLLVASDGKSMVSLHSGSGFANVWRLPAVSRFQRHLYSRSGPHVITPERSLAARQVERGVLTVEDYTEDKQSNVWAAMPTPVRTIWKSEPSDQPLTSLAFAPDATVLAAAREAPGSPVTLFDARTGRELGVLSGHGAQVSALVFWPDGRTLATAGMDQRIRLWDVATKTLRRTLRGHTRPVTGLLLLADGKTLVSSSADGTVRFWDTTSDRPTPQVQLEATLATGQHRWFFTPDGGSILGVERGRVIRFSGPEFRERTTLGGTASVTLLCVAPDVPRYAVARPDTWTRPGTASARVPAVVEIWDYARQEKVGELAVPAEATGPVAFLAQGSRLLLETVDREVALRGLEEWDIATGTNLRRWPRSTTQSMPVVSADGRRCLIRPTNIIGQYPLNYFGELVIPHDDTCALLDLETGIERELPGVQAGFRFAQFSRDGRFLVAPTGPNLSVWETKRFQLEQTIAASGSVQVPQGALFSPDGSRVVAVASGADAVRFWDRASGEQVLSLAVPGAVLAWPAFSPDGNTFGAMTTSGTLHLWRAPSWPEIEAAERAETR
jgi:WD40 repeat protein